MAAAMEISAKAYYIKVCEAEGSVFVELPKEEDDSVLLSTLQSQFPHAIGLKYRAESGAWRAVKAVENLFKGPEEGWGDRVFYCMTSLSEMKNWKFDIKRPPRGSSQIKNEASGSSEIKKRKPENEEHEEVKRSRRNPYLQDLAVLNLSFQTSLEEMRKYFESSYGALVFCELKMCRDNVRSKGYGFIRFKEESAAKEALSAEHNIHGAKVEVKLTEKKPMKLFITRLPQGVTQKQLVDHFSSFGELKDIYMPIPFRGIAFITYASKVDGTNALKASHTLNGKLLMIRDRTNENKQGNKGIYDKRNKGRANYSNYVYNPPQPQSALNPFKLNPL